MRLCVDCGDPIPYGRGWGGGGVCPKCRGKRGAESAKRQAEAAGRVHGATRAKGAKNGEGRRW